MPAYASEPFYGTLVTQAPATPAGAALTAGAANTYGAYVAITGALAADSLLFDATLDTPAVAIEPTMCELSYGVGHTVLGEFMVAFDTAVGTGPTNYIRGMGGLIPSGATGGTTCLCHVGTQPAL